MLFIASPKTMSFISVVLAPNTDYGTETAAVNRSFSLLLRWLWSLHSLDHSGDSSAKQPQLSSSCCPSPPSHSSSHARPAARADWESRDAGASQKLWTYSWYLRSATYCQRGNLLYESPKGDLRSGSPFIRPLGFRDQASVPTPWPSPEEVQVTWSQLRQEQQCSQSQQKELHGWKWPKVKL